ncbi:hypothetical protein BJ322DRAFT_622596 [Thelephora terrestris]|uniref:Uncharacterized protein n=1 Tax=Thelephora terrestris TaxID=56493 RepID=A0A9P6HM87_9AGAM|nr:hypothetical protein BJ322DRAFT_622596 [Thelephora terrestris]
MSTRSPSSPPPSPRISTARLSLYNISQALIRIRRLRHGKPISSSSGPAPITHPSLPGAMSATKIPMNRDDEFICASGVDVPKLLRACRSTLLEQARKIGANVLVDEHWNVSITPQKTGEDGPYKVQIQYSANATRSDRRDPGRPVALDQAISVPGLMTIVKRSK